jgi:hypothetical protein
MQIFAQPHGSPKWDESNVNSLLQIRNNQFAAYYIGPATAYNVNKHQMLVDMIAKRFITSNDKIMFVLGEIDCRAHVVKQSRMQGTSIKSIAQEVADRMFAFIVTNIKYHPIAWGPYYTHSRTVEDSNSAIPFYPVGLPQERNLAIDYYNARLKSLAKSINIPYVSICNNQKVTFSDDIHLNWSSLGIIVEELHKVGIL